MYSGQLLFGAKFLRNCVPCCAIDAFCQEGSRMSSFSRAVFGAAKGAKRLLGLDADLDDPQTLDSYDLDQKLQRARRRIEKQEKKIIRLRAELERAREAGYSAGTAGEDPPMFFIVGRAKSGTSWLMRLLNRHTEILCRGEGRFFGKDSRLSLYGTLSRSEEFRTWLNSNAWMRQGLDPDLQDLVRITVRYLMRERLNKSDKRIVGDKTPFLSEGIVGEIAALFPDAKLVHIIRDGRDVAISGVHHQWNNAADTGGIIELTSEQKARRDAYRADPGAFGAMGRSVLGEKQAAEAARGWRITVERAIEDSASLPRGNYHQIRYEDLLAEPVEETQRLLEFLEADSNEKIARECVAAVSFERMSGRSRGEEDPTSFYRKGIAGDWERYFTRNDKRIFKKEAGELLIKLGYEKDGNW